MIDAIAVVVPARNEQQRVAACLRSIRDAAPLDRRVIVVLTADACIDDTAAIARAEPGVIVVEVAHADVGAARAHGVASALDLLAGVHASRIWIASTDADSTVPPEWLARQLDAADAGADAVLGTVRPDFSELPVGYESVWDHDYARGRAHGHVHGANLGVRASAYLDAGGFRPAPEHEDVQLVERLRASGARIVELDDAEVTTSARLRGRTPGGFAGYLLHSLRHPPVAGADAHPGHRAPRDVHVPLTDHAGRDARRRAESCEQ